MIQSRADRCIDLNDHGQLRGRVTLGKEEAAGWPWSSPSPRATTSDYIWKTQGQASAARTPGGYYINAAQAGEPPGRWWGPGAQALGFASGQVVERRPYDAVYQQRDPRTGDKLGRPRGRYATFADHLAQLKAAEPHATAERVIELEREAAQVTRQPAAYTDVTVSFSKSISVLHASIRENARRARLAGDDRALAYWSGREQRFQEVLHRANRAVLEYLQDWAGVTRTGYHGVRVDGQEPGRFEEAALVVTSWLQGTSRDGQPDPPGHHAPPSIAHHVVSWPPHLDPPGFPGRREGSTLRRFPRLIFPRPAAGQVCRRRPTEPLGARNTGPSDLAAVFYGSSTYLQFRAARYGRYNYHTLAKLKSTIAMSLQRFVGCSV